MPVQEVTISSYRGQHGLSLFVECKPVGIIIESVNKRWGIDVNGVPADPDAMLFPRI